MNPDAPATPPRWYWAVSGFGLIWNLIGLLALVGQMTVDLSELPAAEAEFFASTPGWATASFGIAVSSGVLGSLALLLRKSWAAPMLMLCVAAIFVQSFHSIALTNSIEIFGPEGLIMPVLVFAIAVVLTMVARTANKNAWSR
jgi:hypothetical protein